MSSSALVVAAGGSLCLAALCSYSTQSEGPKYSGFQNSGAVGTFIQTEKQIILNRSFSSPNYCSHHFIMCFTNHNGSNPYVYTMMA